MKNTKPPKENWKDKPLDLIEKEICKHPAIAKGGGEENWRCISCGKITSPPQIKKTKKFWKKVRVLKDKERFNSLFVGKKWVDAYNCGVGAELNCIITILENRAIDEKWDLLQLRDYLKERKAKMIEQEYNRKISNN
jgi:hypothetical protein